MARTWHRWLPAGAVAVVVAGAVGLTSQAGAVNLPDRAPQDVLALMAESSVEAFSGTFETSTELGLPDLAGFAGGFGPPGDRPGPGLHGTELDDAAPDAPPDDDASVGPDAAEALALLTADHTGRVFVAGPDRVRVQLMDGMQEKNLVVNGDEVWVYDSREHAATHIALPELPDAPAHGMRHGMRHGSAPTPDELADAVVAGLDPSTEVTVADGERVAGRDAYVLVLAPRAAETLVESVSIAVDGETGFPLGLTVRAVGQAEPALRAEYTEISFDHPDPGLFDFTPPAGASVEEVEVPAVPGWGSAEGWAPPEGWEMPEDWAPPEGWELPGEDGGLSWPHAPGSGMAPEKPDGGGPLGHHQPGAGGILGHLGEVVGEGWGTVLVLPVGDVPDDPMLAELTEPVDGGRLLTTALVSVLITDDGRLLAGAVTPEHLLSVAGP